MEDASVAGISTKIHSLGIEKKTKKRGIDRSLYLWPSYLFPILDDPSFTHAEAFAKLALQLIGTEYDARDIVLNLKKAFLEVIFSVSFFTVSDITTTDRALAALLTKYIHFTGMERCLKSSCRR
jgi:hypothetical protein